MIGSARDAYALHMDQFHPHFALEEVFRLIQRANKYIDETAPWVLAKDEAKRARLASVMYNLLEALRVALTLLTPFIPESLPATLSAVMSSLRNRCTFTLQRHAAPACTKAS